MFRLGVWKLRLPNGSMTDALEGRLHLQSPMTREHGKYDQTICDAAQPLRQMSQGQKLYVGSSGILPGNHLFSPTLYGIWPLHRRYNEQG